MVQVITDSSVLYTREEAKAAGFEAVPLSIQIGDLDGRDLQVDMEEFYQRIEKGQVPLSSQSTSLESTSLPAIRAFL